MRRELGYQPNNEDKEPENEIELSEINNFRLTLLTNEFPSPKRFTLEEATNVFNQAKTNNFAINHTATRVSLTEMLNLGFLKKIVEETPEGLPQTFYEVLAVRETNIPKPRKTNLRHRKNLARSYEELTKFEEAKVVFLRDFLTGEFTLGEAIEVMNENNFQKTPITKQAAYAFLENLVKKGYAKKHTKNGTNYYEIK